MRVRDITQEVAAVVRASGISDGICCVYTRSRGSIVRVNEMESGFFEDFAALLARLVPAADATNGASGSRERCVSMLLGPAGESIPVQDGGLYLGLWQRVLLVDVDRRAKHVAEWQVQVVGA